jgi:ADP-heptose:LPS heptosyltransferase
MRDELNAEVVIIGGKAELESEREFHNRLALAGDIINLTGKTSLKGLAGLLKKCKLLVSGDSGPVHLACAVGTPVLAIFRNDIPAKGAKRWGPCNPGSVVVEKPNLAEITVEEVFEKAKRILNK